MNAQSMSRHEGGRRLARYGIYELADLPWSEYEHRIMSAQRLMLNRGIDGLLLVTEENVNYFSGYRTTTGAFTKDYTPAILLIPVKGTASLFLSISMRGNAEAMTQLDNVQYVGWDGLENLTMVRFPHDVIETTLNTIKSAGMKTIGVEYDNYMRVAISQTDLTKIESGIQGSNVIDCGPLIWELRTIKSPKEIGLLLRCCEITCRGFDAGFTALKEGMTERKFARAVYIGMLEAGGEDTPLKMWLNTKGGRDRYFVSDARPSMKRLRKGDVVVLDGGTCYRGYYSDITRMASIGKPSKKQQELFRVAREAQEIGVDALRAGEKLGDVYELVVSWVRKEGYSKHQMYEGIGHGIGLDFHEPPFINSISEVVLQPGMVLTMEPCLYDLPVIRSTLEGAKGGGEGLFFVEDMVLVTRGKPRVLSSMERDLVIA